MCQLSDPYISLISLQQPEYIHQADGECDLAQSQERSQTLHGDCRSGQGWLTGGLSGAAVRHGSPKQIVSGAGFCGPLSLILDGPSLQTGMARPHAVSAARWTPAPEPCPHVPGQLGGRYRGERPKGWDLRKE